MNCPQRIGNGRGVEFSRRSLLVGAVAAACVPRVHAGEDNTIRVALIGCGGRGAGAAANALSVNNGPIKLVAMADIFEDKLARSFEQLKMQFSAQVDVPEDRKFIGFDAYRKAVDCLKPGDVAIFATYPAFRWVHFGYAIQKGVNVFIEKPLSVDGPTTRKMLQLAAESVEEEPQGWRRADGPPLSRPTAAQAADPGRRDRRDHRHAGLSHVGADQHLPVAPEAGGDQRAALPDPAFGEFPLGQRRLLQRFQYPPDRRMLVDEGGLAGPRKPLAAATSAAIRSTRTSTTTPSSTPTPTALSCSSTAAISPAATTRWPATRTAPRAPPSFPQRATRRARCGRSRDTT